MATTAILRSQDCLLRSNNSFHYEALPFFPHPKPNPKRQSRVSRHRKRSPDQTTSVSKSPGKNLVMGQVKILKRGEVLRPPTDLIMGSTERLGPEPETVQKQIRVSDLEKLYAGSAVLLASPPPSSLPLPAFFSKKNRDTASSDLRRLLRLDLN